MGVLTNMFCYKHSKVTLCFKLNSATGWIVNISLTEDNLRGIKQNFIVLNSLQFLSRQYFDYVSKVLLPETLVMVYMRVERKTRLEVSFFFFVTLLKVTHSTCT